MIPTTTGSSPTRREYVANEESCGIIRCGAGCTCTGVGSHECMCPRLGAP